MTERELRAQDARLTELLEALMFECWCADSADDELDRDPAVPDARVALEKYIETLEIDRGGGHVWNERAATFGVVEKHSTTPASAEALEKYIASVRVK